MGWRRPVIRVVAVDWSGALIGAERKIWLAEAGNRGVARLECGRSREEVAAHLIDMAGADGELIAGMDFAFSMPAWWLDRQGIRDAPVLWRWLGDGHAERLLASCEAPFWGRRGTRKPRDCALLRATDRATIAGGGAAPKSVFQIAGAGAVGTASLRGMPLLADLRDAGFAIWPFDPPRLPMAIEIWPRTCTGPVVKTNAAARRERAIAHADRMTAAMIDACTASDDAFDACMSALAMWDHRDDLGALPAIGDPLLRREGIIWHPGWRAAHANAARCA